MRDEVEVSKAVESSPPVQAALHHPAKARIAALWQMLRFGMAGAFNVMIDVATLNLLLWRFPVHDASLLLIYNSVAYMVGGVSSFILHKYWTFRTRGAISHGEVLRFVLVIAGGFLWNDSLIWIVGTILHPFIASTLLWANLSKASAAVGTASVTYIAMRRWVFVKRQERAQGIRAAGRLPMRSSSSEGATEAANETYQIGVKRSGGKFCTNFSLSVILPAHNEEAVIAHTLYAVIQALTTMVQDFEIIVVNDGSKDRTGQIVGELASVYPRVRLITHPINQEYGAAMVTGFEAVTKDLAFLMDADGQFDIYDLYRFFPLIEHYDAVLGYRIDRQDAWMRKFNAWGWRMLVRAVFGLRVRDVDCAFKLYRADFFSSRRLEARGAMINIELLYKFTRAGYTYTEIGVNHLPRQAGRAKGAKFSVMLRAFRELAFFARKWRREERAMAYNLH